MKRLGSLILYFIEIKSKKHMDRNPNIGEIIPIPAYKKIKFKINKQLKDAFN